jgi:hypothetical protein
MRQEAFETLQNRRAHSNKQFERQKVDRQAYIRSRTSGESAPVASTQPSDITSTQAFTPKPPPLPEASSSSSSEQSIPHPAGSPSRQTQSRPVNPDGYKTINPDDYNTEESEKSV